MAKESLTDLKPPYVTYTTFNNLINGFREGVLPSRIDRSVMPGTANGVQTYLLSALRFFGLTNEQGVPTNDFKALVDEKDDLKRKAEWKRIVERSYDFIFNGGLDLQRATESQLDEKFREKGLDGATLRKCHTFFTKAVEAAGIALGPHAKSSTKSSGGSPRSSVPRKKQIRRSQVTTDATDDGDKDQKSSNGIREMLLAKFPDFDPKWDNELKKAWFSDFAELKKWGEKTE
jgi:uncharacterized protein DUF5343